MEIGNEKKDPPPLREDPAGVKWDEEAVQALKLVIQRAVTNQAPAGPHDKTGPASQSLVTVALPNTDPEVATTPRNRAEVRAFIRLQAVIDTPPERRLGMCMPTTTTSIQYRQKAPHSSTSS